MRKLILSAAVATATLWASSALPCGGGFGEGLTIDPSQKIVVKHDSGVETYIFRPHFCGRAAQFGLILPIPGQLSANPELAEAKLFDELDTFTAPKIEKVTQCQGTGMDAGADGGGYGDASNGVDVIDAGQVGIFDWTLLQADSSAAFTDWLDTNGYPYDPTAAQHFGYYVAKTWYFVAFKVTAGQNAPPAGKELCGDLGPLSLSFFATQAVVPARIAAVDTSNPYMFGWQVFGISSDYVRSDSPNVYPTVKFAGPFSAADATSYPEIAKVASAGDKITKLNVGFYGSEITTDIDLVANSQQAEYRDTKYEVTWIDCDGGAGAGGAGAGGDGGAGGSGGSSASGGTGANAAGTGTDPAASPTDGDDDGGCSIAPSHARFGMGLGLAALALGLVGLRRRRS